jgi:hypothetical protein
VDEACDERQAMARALTAEEQQRYPWASQITDYVPVGRWRRIGGIVAGVGLAWFMLGAATVFVIRKSVQLKGGLPHSGLSWGAFGPAMGLMAVAFVVGAVTGVTAAARRLRIPLVWSIGAMVPALLWLVLYLLSHR